MAPVPFPPNLMSPNHAKDFPANQSPVPFLSLTRMYISFGQSTIWHTLGRLTGRRATVSNLSISFCCWMFVMAARYRMMILLVSVFPAPDSPKLKLSSFSQNCTGDDDAGVPAEAFHRTVSRVGDGEGVRRTLVDLPALEEDSHKETG